MSASRKARDIAERTLWTAAEAGVAYLATRAAGVGAEWGVPLATFLAYVKSVIATKIGDSTAALPAPK